jgi:hypothetical protein
MKKKKPDFEFENVKIYILRSERITPTETQWDLDVNGKNVYVSKWVDDDFCTDYEIFKGKELLDEDEEEAVVEFIDEQIL